MYITGRQRSLGRTRRRRVGRVARGVCVRGSHAYVRASSLLAVARNHARRRRESRRIVISIPPRRVDAFIIYIRHAQAYEKGARDVETTRKRYRSRKRSNVYVVFRLVATYSARTDIVARRAASVQYVLRHVVPTHRAHDPMTSRSIRHQNYCTSSCAHRPVTRDQGTRTQIRKGSVRTVAYSSPL